MFLHKHEAIATLNHLWRNIFPNENKNYSDLHNIIALYLRKPGFSNHYNSNANPPPISKTPPHVEINIFGPRWGGVLKKFLVFFCLKYFAKGEFFGKICDFFGIFAEFSTNFQLIFI